MKNEDYKGKLEEIRIRIEKEISEGESNPKTMARLAVIFFETFQDKEEYDEEIIVRIVKRIWEFYNKGFLLAKKLEELPKKKKNIEGTQEIFEKLEEKFPKLISTAEFNGVITTLDIEELPKDINRQINTLSQESKGLKGKLKSRSINKKVKKIAQLLLNYKNINEIALQEMMDENREQIENIEDIYNDLKSTLMDEFRFYNPKLGGQLESFSYDDIISDQGKMSYYTYNVLIRGLYDGFLNFSKPKKI